jgi:hypothetical protein
LEARKDEIVILVKKADIKNKKKKGWDFQYMPTVSSTIIQWYIMKYGYTTGNFGKELLSLL